MNKNYLGFYGILIISILTIISSTVIMIFGIIYEKDNMILISSNLITSIISIWVRSPRFKKERLEL